MNYTLLFLESQAQVRWCITAISISQWYFCLHYVRMCSSFLSRLHFSRMSLVPSVDENHWYRFQEQRYKFCMKESNLGSSAMLYGISSCQKSLLIFGVIFLNTLHAIPFLQLFFSPERMNTQCITSTHSNKFKGWYSVLLKNTEKCDRIGPL